jgi:hypothetical protein
MQGRVVQFLGMARLAEAPILDQYMGLILYAEIACPLVEWI